MKVKGMFRKWKIESWTASCEEFCIWHKNGFMFFDDIQMYSTDKPFLAKLRLFTKWRIWRELKREMRRRAKNKIADMVKEV